MVIQTLEKIRKPGGAYPEDSPKGWIPENTALEVTREEGLRLIEEGLAIYMKEGQLPPPLQTPAGVKKEPQELESSPAEEAPKPKPKRGRGKTAKK